MIYRNSHPLFSYLDTAVDNFQKGPQRPSFNRQQHITDEATSEMTSTIHGPNLCKTF